MNNNDEEKVKIMKEVHADIFGYFAAVCKAEAKKRSKKEEEKKEKGGKDEKNSGSV